MKNLLSMNSVKKKMLVGFSVVIFMVLILGAFNYYSINKINNETTNIVDKQVPLLIANEKLASNIAKRISSARGYALFGDEDYKEQFNTYTEESVQLQADLLELTNSEAEEQLINQSIDWRNAVINSVFEPLDNGYEDVALQNLKNIVRPKSEELMKQFEEHAKKSELLIEEEGQSILDASQIILLVSLGVSILVVILGIITALITSRTIANPINKVMERINLIANRDLSLEPLKTKSKDEIGQLIGSTNLLNNNMRELLQQMNTVSETVNSQGEELTQSANEVKAGSQQIATTMQELASGTESQANIANDLSTVMESFTVKMQEANENGENIYKSSNDVLGMTTEGAQLMEVSVKQMATVDRIVQEAVDKVKGLDAQSQEITKLVSVIKDIAEQTNLLALNAAIEAARAGEHGKGFAVVADEVRKLAEQVGVSVTDITGIVDSIQTESTGVVDSLQGGYKEVEKGTDQMRTTKETFTEIDGAVKGMVEKIQTVTNNLSEMSISSQKMNTSVEEIASVSEESAAGVEQTSASAQQASSSMEEVSDSSDELAKLTEELNGLIRQFKL